MSDPECIGFCVSTSPKLVSATELCIGEEKNCPVRKALLSPASGSNACDCPQGPRESFSIDQEGMMEARSQAGALSMG